MLIHYYYTVYCQLKVFLDTRVKSVMKCFFLPFLCSRRSGGFWLSMFVLVSLALVAPVWLLCPTGAGGAGAVDDDACTGLSRVELVKISSLGLVGPVIKEKKPLLDYKTDKKCNSYWKQEWKQNSITVIITCTCRSKLLPSKGCNTKLAVWWPRSPVVWSIGPRWLKWRWSCSICSSNRWLQDTKEK